MNIQTDAHGRSAALDTSHLGVDFPFKEKYGNFIGGQFVDPKGGQWFKNVTPITGEVITTVARSDAADIEAALDAAHAAAPAFGKTSLAERSNMLFKIAQRIEDNLMTLAVAETLDNGKPIRESVNADLALAVDHFRYFGGVIRGDEGSIAEIDANTYAYHFHEPLGVVAQIIPWNFPILMAVWKLAPALAAGNAVVLKPAEQTPASIMVMMELIADLIPDGVVNIVNGYGPEAGQALANSDRIAKLAFTGETTTGQIIMRAAAESLIPVTLELGGKSPNVFFSDIMSADDAFFDKCLEGFAMFALNQGEVCTCPSRALVQEDIADEFLKRGIERVQKIKQGNPLQMDTMIGGQASTEQMDKITGYLKLGREEGAQVLTGGDKSALGDGMDDGYFIQPTVFRGDNSMRIFQEEIFGPVLSVTTFKDEAEAIKIANDTTYGLGAGVWTRDANRCFRMGRSIEAGRVWVNCYHHYPAHAAFGGYKKSGIGRENHKMMLDHYRNTKNMLVSYDENPMGFF
ncbi:MAG: aldehyde dehydrogenase family protein [Pseudomonadota bacterium]